MFDQRRRLKVETGPLACMGCGREYDCGIHGCRIVREAADLIEKLTDRCARATPRRSRCCRNREVGAGDGAAAGGVANDETSELVNYMIFTAPDFGVDIGNYHANAKNGFAWHYL